MNSPETSPPDDLRAASLPFWRVGIAAVLLGLALSAAYCYWDTQTESSLPQEIETQNAAVVSLPQGGIQTDAFSIRLLQAALHEQQGNVSVAPSAVTEAILGLQAVDGRGVDETCQRFGLQSREPSTATLPNHYFQIFVDESQAMGAENRSLMTLPIRRAPIEASAFINRLVQPPDRDSDLMLEASDVHAGDQFITAVDQRFEAPWLHPVGRQHTIMLPFTTRTGMPDTPTMQVADLFRVAQAPDDTWEAVAMFFSRTARSEDDWVCLVMVRPKVGTARRMAERLTAEQVSEIRKALAEAPARPYNLQVPPLRVDASPRDILPLLQTMGLNPQPLAREGDNKGQQARGSLFLQFSIRAGESDASEGRSAAGTVESYPMLRLNSSYLWWIGSLTSPAPFLYMGIVEQP